MPATLPTHRGSLSRGKLFEPGTTLRYARSSSPSEAAAQRDSIPQQFKSLDKGFGVLPEHIPGTTFRTLFSDKMSGRSFNRPDYEELKAFCLTHPQPPENKCRVELYHPSRFARPIRKDVTTGELKAETREAYAQLIELARAGWHLRFLHGVPDSESEVVNDVIFMFAIESAAKVSADLTVVVARGKYGAASRGLWPYATPPFGTQRWCLKRQIRLADSTGEKTRDHEGELVTVAGEYGQKGSTILVEVDDEIAVWNVAADMCVRGAPIQKIVEYMNSTSHRNSRFGLRWDARAVRHMLTNQVLIGKVPYAGRETQGKRVYFDAQWEPFVDVEKFQQVVDELDARDAKRGKRPEPYMSRVLSGLLFCADCGCLYSAKTYSRQAAGKKPMLVDMACYNHRPSSYYRATPEMKEVRAQLGCKDFRLDAKAVELAVRDLLIEQRTGPQWGVMMKELYDAALDNVERVGKSLEQSKARVKELTKQCRNLAQQVASESDPDMGRMYADMARQKSKELKEAQRAVDDAEAESRRSGDDWAVIEELLDETRDVLTAWDSFPLEDRLRIVHYWVKRIDVQFQKPATREEGRPYILHVWLRHVPDLPTSIVCRNTTRRERKREQVEARARELGVRAYEVCAGCLDAPCSCSKTSDGSLSVDVDALVSSDVGRSVVGSADKPSRGTPPVEDVVPTDCILW